MFISHCKQTRTAFYINHFGMVNFKNAGGIAGYYRWNNEFCFRILSRRTNPDIQILNGWLFTQCYQGIILKIIGFNQLDKNLRITNIGSITCFF